MGPSARKKRVPQDDNEVWVPTNFQTAIARLSLLVLYLPFLSGVLDRLRFERLAAIDQRRVIRRIKRMHLADPYPALLSMISTRRLLARTTV